MKGWEAGKTFEMYIIKCLEFCWIQILENKEVMIEDNLKALSKIMPHKYKKIEPSKVTVTWPALVDTENIVEDAVLENKADMAAVRLSKKQTTGKGKSEDTEDVTEQYNIDSHGNSKPVSKGENGKSYDVDKTKGSPSKLPGEVEHKESKLSGRDAPGAKQEEKSEQSERDAPTVKPRVESGESSSDKSKTGSQIQKQQTNKTSASGKKQTSKTHPTSKNLDF